MSLHKVEGKFAHISNSGSARVVDVEGDLTGKVDLDIATEQVPVFGPSALFDRVRRTRKLRFLLGGADPGIAALAGSASQSRDSKGKAACGTGANIGTGKTARAGVGGSCRAFGVEGIMGRGSYFGGSTIFGRWSDTRDFPSFERPDPSSSPSKLTRRRPSSAERRRAREEQRLEKLDRLARDLGLMRDEALVHAGRPKLPAGAKARAARLKELVAEGFLLPTGRPNPEHPQLTCWANGLVKSKNEQSA